MTRGWIIAATTLCFVLIAGTSMADDPKTIKVTGPDGTVIVTPDGTSVNTPGAGMDTGRGDDGALKYNCTGNRDLLITDKVITAVDGVVFRATGNCTMKLRNLVVTGFGIIAVSGNATVEVQDCTFTGSSVAIDAGGTSNVRIKKTVITAPAGIVASGNTKIHIEDSTITSSETAVQTRGMAEVNLVRTLTTGKRVNQGSATINEK